MTSNTPPFGRTVPGNRWDLVRDVHAPVRTVSVIVPHYRQQAELDRTLAALARQTHPANALQVVVVDDGSPEPPRVPDGVRLVRQRDEGFRLAAARNAGVAASDGEILCFLDADTAPEPDYVARMTRLPSLLPEAVTVGRRRHADFRDASTPVEVAGPAAALPEPSWLTESYRASADLLRSDDRSYRYLIGAVTACSRWFFEQVGGFDEDFREYGGEDWEWAYRAWLAGGIFCHVPDAVAWHDGPDWAGRDARNGARRVLKNRESLTLARKIPVSGSRGHAVRTATSDVEVRLTPSTSDAATFICVDSLLALVPEAQVLLPADAAALFPDDRRVVTESDSGGTPPRVRIDVIRPVQFNAEREASASLRVAIREVGVDALAAVEFGDDAGLVLTVTSARAFARERRWSNLDGWQIRSRISDWKRLDGAEPELAAYLGGWG